MREATLKPGIVVNEDMLKKVNLILKKHTKCKKTLTWKEFGNKKFWTFIPNIHGEAYKVEILVHRDNDKETIRVHLWLQPDIRDTEEYKPHDHPWDFEAYIVDGGGYEELRWIVGPDGKIKKVKNVYKVGDVNRIKAVGEYHVVAKLFGNPLTVMVAGPVDYDHRWGYLDLKTGEHIEAAKGDDPNFKMYKARLNS